MIYLLFVIGALTLLYVYYKKVYSYWSDRGVPQTKPIWLLGDDFCSTFRLKQITEDFQKIYDLSTDAKYIGFYKLTKPCILIKDPDIIKKITVKDFDHFVDRTMIIDTTHDKLWSRNLFALEGQKWKDTRTMLTPTFTNIKMKAMYELVSNCCEKFINHFTSANGEKHLEIDVDDVITRFTNDAIATTAFGLDIDSLKNKENDFYAMGQSLLKFDLELFFKFALYQFLPKIYKMLKLPLFNNKKVSFYEKIVEEIVKIRKEKGIVRPDVIQILLEAQQSEKKNGKNVEITQTDIVAHAFLFFLGGFDTVSSSLNNLIYELAMHQDIQDRLRKEILETKEKHNGEIPFDVLMQMKYLDMTVSEVLRMRSPMPQLFRKCTKSYVLEPALPGGKPLEIEQGAEVIIPHYNIHRDPKLFSNPLKFDPERFNDDNRHKINPYTYLPFGVGPRNCIGARFSLMEIKTLVVYLLSTFQIVSTEKTYKTYQLCVESISPRQKGLILGLKRLN